MTMERLKLLLEAYGADPRRWPAEERAAAQRLLEASPAARQLRAQAAQLDEMLDALPLERPSAALAERVLAAAPRRSSAPRAWRWALIAAPLAAAAALVLWLTAERGTRSGVQLARTRTSAIAGRGEPAPTAVRGSGDSADDVVLGAYTAPTDALLGSFAVDVSSAWPTVGCSDSALGCPKLDGASEPISQRRAGRRVLA